MRMLAIAALVLALIPEAHAESPRLHWPLQPGPATVTRHFDAPSPDWRPGHRGVDLAGTPGQPVYAAGPGTVVFAGTLAGRPLVSIAHHGGLHTSYEPVAPGEGLRAGMRVDTGAALGRLVAGHAGCPVAACLHWGAMWGPASRADYVDPLDLLAGAPIRLKPLQARGWA